MQNLKLEATKYTPEINLDIKGTVSFVGKSYPENTFEFYKPINNWILDYFKITTCEKTTINLNVEYMNSSSLKAYFDMFDSFEEAHNDGKALEINWIYDKEDDISEETGEDFIEDFESLNIKLIIK